MADAKIYYDEDADLTVLDGKKIGVIGYGIQGRAQALNLRDSGLDVRVGNRDDEYKAIAGKDGFDVQKPRELAQWADVILFLIPDDAQAEVFDSWLKPCLSTGKSLVFAHGFALYHERLDLPDDIDILLMAPRMPGKYIRERYLRGWGVPVFVDVYRDHSGHGLATVLALSKAIGATRSGAMEITTAEETEIDLFIEQFLLPTITATIHKAFDFLVAKGFTPEAVVSELYASKEIGELIAHAGDTNLYQVFRDNASPTCQFGKMRGMPVAENMISEHFMTRTLTDIRDRTFGRELRVAAQDDYKALKDYDARIDQSKLVATHRTYNAIHRGETE
jgi:ketol-acid reductoisomerase